MTLRLVLPYPVSANRYWQTVYVGKGAQKRAIMVPTREAKAYREMVGHIAKLVGLVAPITGRVHVHIDLYPERPKDWAKRAQKDPDGWDGTVRCLDLDNARKVVYDSLKGIAFGDDNLVFADSAERREPDALGARVVVTITPYQRQQTAPGLFGEAA